MVTTPQKTQINALIDKKIMDDFKLACCIEKQSMTAVLSDIMKKFSQERIASYKEGANK